MNWLSSCVSGMWGGAAGATPSFRAHDSHRCRSARLPPRTITSWTVASLSHRSHFTRQSYRHGEFRPRTRRDEPAPPGPTPPTRNAGDSAPQRIAPSVNGRVLIFTDSPPLADHDPRVRRYMQDMPQLNLYRENELPAQADRLAAQLERTPEGRRAIHPFYILARQLKAAEYPVDAVGIYERGSIDATRDTAGMAHLAQRLAARGVRLDLVYCDCETDLTPWTLGDERLREVYRSPAARARMPERLREFDVERLKFMSAEYHEWMIHLVPYAESIRAAALRRAIVDSGLSEPPEWSDRTTLVNYHMFRTSFRVYDYNGWEIETKALVDHRTSCPVLYPGPRGHRYRDRAHHAVWNNLIDCINHCRTATATSRILPVIREHLRVQGQAAGTVDPGARWLMEQLLGHAIRAGADRFMMFHYLASAADDAAVAEIIERHAEALPVGDARPVLPEIPLDVDEIVTGDLRTGYSEFLEQEPDRWLKQA